MSSVADSLAGAALRLAEAGWYVLALQRNGKVPAITRGARNASRDPVQLEQWWQRDAFNIGVATGAASDLTVVDLDSDDTTEALLQTALVHGGVPRTVISRTPRGSHLFFKHVPELGNRVRVGGLDLDVRSEGGYVVVPPSRLSPNRIYNWVSSPWTTPIATMPSWLRVRLRSPASDRPHGTTRHAVASASSYGLAALRREADRLSKASVGSRNSELNTSAFRIGTLCESCSLSDTEIKQQLVAACRANGLVRDDGLFSVVRTIASGLRAGRAKPRRLNGVQR